MNPVSSLKNRRDRRIFFKWSARRAMSENGNLLRLIFGVLLLVLLSDSLLHLCDIITSLVPVLYGTILYTAVSLICLILTAPFFYGIVRMAFLMSEGRETRISDVLWGYDTPMRMRHLYEVFLPRVLKDLIVGGASYFAVIGVEKLVSDTENIREEFALSPVAFCASFALAILLSGFMPTAFILPEMCFLEEEGITLDVSNAKRNARRCFVEITLFNLSFLGITVLSVLTLGILHFVYVIPYYLLARANFVSYIISRGK